MKPRFNSLRSALAVSLVLSLGLAHSAQAAALTWDADNVTTGAQDGSDITGDIWGVTGQLGNWRNTTTSTNNVDWTAGDAATFGAGTDGTYAVTVGGNISALTLYFANSGYTLSGSAARVITLTGTSNILGVASTESATIGTNVTVTRSGGYNIYGGGTLNITGTGATVTNSGTGAIFVNGGTTVNVGAGGIFSASGTSGSVVAGGDAVAGSAINVTGGAVNPAASLVMGNSSATGTITLTSGEINQTNTTTGLGTRFGGTSGTPAGGTFHLDGGVLTTTRVFEGTTSASSTFNFNGGTLKVASGTTYASTFMTGLDTAQIRNNGAKIDTNAQTVTIGQQLIHSTIGGDNATDGGLTLNDTAVTKGTLTLSNANTYTGDTTVKAGTLALSSTGTIANSAKIIVGDAGSSGTVLDVTAKASFAIGSAQTLKGIGNINIGAGKTVTVNGTLAAGNSIGTNSVTGNLTLAGTTEIELGTTGASHAAPGTSDRTDVSGALTLGGGLTVINNGGIGAGSYKIFSQAGTATGSFSSITNVAGYHAKVDTATSGSVFLDNYALATTGTIAAVNLGKARVGGSFSGSGALSVSNTTAANNGFTEGLNATQGAITGGVIAGGSNVSNLAGASSSTTLTAGFSTATSGAKSGTTTIDLASSGTNSGYADTSLTSQTVGVTGNVYDYATALFSQTGGDGSLTGSGTSYTLDFGSALALSTYYTATIQLANGTFFNAFQDNLGGSYTTGGAGEFSNTAASFSNLVSNGNNSFTVTFFTGSTGTFNGTLDFAGLSQQADLTDANLANINIAFTGTAVPEPNVAALLGGLGVLALLRRRRA